MREHYSLVKLADYSIETIADPTQVVNPAYRDLDGQVRSQLGKLNRLLACFGTMHSKGTLDVEKLDAILHKKANLQDAIKQQKSVVEALKKARKETLHDNAI
jgi:hypothetical protein